MKRIRAVSTAGTAASVRAAAVAAATVATAGLLTACGADTEPTPTTTTTKGISAVTPSIAPASTITVTSVPLTPAATDVDPAAYATAGSPGYYRWAYAHNPLRECALGPAVAGLAQRITCSAPYPADAAAIQVDVFSGPPNAITLTASGTEPTIVEGGPTPAADLPANSRITFGDLSCTALPNDGITCESPDASFSVVNGVLTHS